MLWPHIPPLDVEAQWPNGAQSERQSVRAAERFRQQPGEVEVALRAEVQPIVEVPRCEVAARSGDGGWQGARGGWENEPVWGIPEGWVLGVIPLHGTLAAIARE